MDNSMDKFTDAIIKDANEQKKRLLSELEKEKQKEIEKAEAEILNDIFHKIQSEISDIKNYASREISKKSFEMRKELLKKRDEFTEEVFKKLKAKLIEFTASEEYKSYLFNLLQASFEKTGKENLNIEICERDKTVLEKICKDLSVTPEFVVNDDIEIGGFIIQSPEKSIKIIETLDRKVIEQREYFGEISGMSLS